MLATTMVLGWALLVAPAPVVFRGMCDASGAVVLEDTRFVVADDEDNVLRVYDGDRGGEPLGAFDVSTALDLPLKKKGVPEADLEAATRLGDQALWLASHGRNRKGEVDRNRMRFFATSLPTGTPLRMVGRPYRRLLDDLLAAPGLADLGLQLAALRAPKQQGGLNIEGMTARPDGRTVLLGFRSPLVRGQAILVPLMNPLGVMKNERGRFGERVLLDLAGLGVRSLSWWRGRYIIVAGPVDQGAPSRLYTWDGAAAPKPVSGIDLTGFNPEGIAAFPHLDRLLLLSDDGTREIDGQPCKKLSDPRRKQFRGFWVTVP
jgi:hypothetical protein